MNKKGGIKSFPLQGTKPQFRIFLGNFSEEKMKMKKKGGKIKLKWTKSCE